MHIFDDRECHKRRRSLSARSDYRHSQLLSIFEDERTYSGSKNRSRSPSTLTTGDTSLEDRSRSENSDSSNRRLHNLSRPLIRRKYYDRIHDDKNLLYHRRAYRSQSTRAPNLLSTKSSHKPFHLTLPDKVKQPLSVLNNKTMHAECKDTVRHNILHQDPCHPENDKESLEDPLSIHSNSSELKITFPETTSPSPRSTERFSDLPLEWWERSPECKVSAYDYIAYL